MFETLERVLAWVGPDKKAVVWAHNSHIGDARFTDMGTERGEFNIGQLCREAYGQDAALIGFSTHTGTVAAASEWDAPMEIKAVRPSRPDSYEALCHEVGQERFLLDFARAGAWVTSRAWPNLAWNATSGSSTGPKPSVGVTIRVRRFRTSTTLSFGSTKPTR